MGSSFFKMFRGNRPQDPMEDPKTAHVFLDSLPKNDPLGLLEAIVAMLEDRGAGMALMSSNRVQALLVLDRGSLVAQSSALLQYRAPNISDDARRRLWHAGNGLSRWFAHAYERASAANVPAADSKGSLAVPLHGIYSRMFHYRGVQAKLGLFRHESWIPGSWKVLHDAYRQALARSDPGEPFGLEESAIGSGRTSAEQEFIEILLLQRVNSGNLSIEEVECASNWLMSWVQRLKLEKAPPTGDGFWLDLNRSEGLLGDRPPAAGEDLLYLDIGPLHQQLGATIGRLSAQLGQPGAIIGAPEQRAASEQLKLARRLDPLWRPHAEHRPRRGERKIEKGTIVVAAGWTAIATAIPLPSSPGRPEGHRGYSFEDVTSVQVYGHVRNLAGDRFGTTIQKSPDRHQWQMHDTSDSGVLIMSSTREAQKQQIGALLALRAEGDLRWQIGIVRRLRRRTAEHTELGVEVVARQVQMMLVTRASSRDGGYTGDTVAGTTEFSALDLRPLHAAKAPIRSMIMPAAEFTPGRSLSITFSGARRDIRLFAPLEQTREWVWTAYEMAGEAKRA